MRLLIITLLIILLTSTGLSQTTDSNSYENPNLNDAQTKDGIIVKESYPRGYDPADYGFNSAGALWQDSIIQAEKYTLNSDVTITTHTHGIIIYAKDLIEINGIINVQGLGSASEFEKGYDLTNRISLMKILDSHGEINSENNDLLLYGSSGKQDCGSGIGGGYIILHSQQIIINGELDARGTGCAESGIVYLESNDLQSNGKIWSNMIIQRGI